MYSYNVNQNIFGVKNTYQPTFLFEEEKIILMVFRATDDNIQFTFEFKSQNFREKNADEH